MLTMPRKLEETMIKNWESNQTFDQAYLTALKYLDLSRLAETTSETVVSYLNAALWLHHALSLSLDSDEPWPRYKIKEGILKICRDMSGVAKEASHPGMQAFVSWQAVCLVHSSIHKTQLVDEEDLPLFEKIVRNWLYSIRLCPVGVPLNIFVCEASMVDCLLSKVHVAYIDSLAAMDDSQVQPAVPLVTLEHARFESFIQGLNHSRSRRDACDQESTRLKALEAAMRHAGIHRTFVQQAQHAEYAGRNDDGWRPYSPAPKAQPQDVEIMKKVHELLQKLKSRRLTTDPPPDLARRLSRATDTQRRSVVGKLLRRLDSERLNCLQNGESSTKSQELVDDLCRTFQQQFLAAESAPLPEAERELRDLLCQLSKLHPPRSVVPIGRRLHGVTFHYDGHVDFMIEELGKTKSTWDIMDE